MKNDSVRLFQLQHKNEGFNALFSKPSAKMILAYINNAIGCLNGISCPLDMTAGVNYILSYALQLLIRSLCKSLMQIMTPEGLINYWKFIPCSYLDAYLHHQTHFGLKGIIEQEGLAKKNSALVLHG